MASDSKYYLQGALILVVTIIVAALALWALYFALGGYDPVKPDPFKVRCDKAHGVVASQSTTSYCLKGPTVLETR